MLCCLANGKRIRGVFRALPNYLSSHQKLMPRNTPEREILVDLFDDDISYAYAYAYQSEQNGYIAELVTMAQEVRVSIERSEMLSELPPNALSGMVHTVMNVMQSSVRDGKITPRVSSADWLNSPVQIGYQRFFANLCKNHWPAWEFLQRLHAKLEDELPEEIKSIATQGQVLVLARLLAKSEKIPEDTCIHLPSMAKAVHTALTRKHAAHKPAPEDDILLSQAMEQYRNGCSSAGIAAITDCFVTNQVTSLFDRARKIDLAIDQHYPWGVLIVPPRSARQMLADLASLISQETGWYTKWKREQVTAAIPEISTKQFMLRGQQFGPRALPRSDGQIFYSTERSDILIDGRPLQHHLIMVVPYDRPSHELGRKLDRFKKYSEHRHAQYRVDIQEPDAKSAERLARSRSVTLEPKAKRLILEDVRSIPAHLAALRTFESDRPATQAKAATSLHVDLHSELQEHGFTLSRYVVKTAVEKACKYRDKVIHALNN